MNTTNYIRIFRGDDSDALGYQTIVGTIKTDLDLTGCKAVFRFLGFYAEFNPIPEDKKLTIVIPAQASRGFPPGVGYASLKVFDSLGKIRTFTNRIPVIVDTMTPSCGCGEFEVSFSPFPELEPLKIFIGPNADNFDQYTGFISKIIDRASLVKYGLAMLADAMSEDGGASGKAASPLAVKAAYDAVIKELVDNYYTAEQTEEAIDRVAAYYITYTAAGAAFPTYASLANATTVYSGGKVRVPTRNDYCVVLADETHQGAEYRYIYAVAEGETIGSWQPQFPVGGVMTVDQSVTKNSRNPVASSGIWYAIWGALSALPTGFASLYDWCVAQLAGKASKADVDPLLFAQYYPDGSVKSAAEFRSDIKYNLDAATRTATVKPFCVTGDSANDNSSLAGRVVIPPFVDAGGNGYISDDGTRCKVVEIEGEYGGDEDNNSLTSIVVPTTVTEVGEYAFAGCASLVSASFPSVTSIGGSVFGYCTSLASMSLPAVTGIGYGAFQSCDHLASVSLPAVSNIGDFAFGQCSLLDSIDFGDTPRPTVPTLGADAFMGVPTSCLIIVPDAQYDAWIAAPGWSDLVTAGYKFLKHSEWEYARKYEVDKKADKPATFTEGNLAKFDTNGNPTDSTIPAVNVATKGEIPYSLGTPIVIDTASSETIGGETVYYGVATLANRTANIVQVTAATALDELRITFPAATSGKVRDFGLRVEIGTGSAAFAAPALVPIATTGETIKIENNAAEIPALADGAATAKGVTLLYFSETAPGVFVVKGEQVEEVA